ncbi:hypothetical protein QBC34DRAFT_470040 [Podospora aff. communis PSN243]|uniref:Uncharacterized protein n=1 Tax=Podospora aff. communis PSN243 TaxID=3040156 RepID=A0AAV9GCR8_9PEZI|nr:hypothetical protein QBC34DRAFT_470040 [Podospora aff. communis PSN243]
MKLSIAIVAALTAASNAVIVQLFSDTNCRVAAGERNVWDNSCAPTGGFQSYRITFPGAYGQKLLAYSRNACVAPHTSCVSASYRSGICERATNAKGGSNALGSFFVVC